MNTLDYETIAQGEVDLLSPVSSERLDRVIDRLELPEDARVIDLCCGKGEVLVRTLARYGCTGDGLDASPAFLAAARAEASGRLTPGQATFAEVDVSFHDVESESYDLVIITNARPWGDYEATLQKAWAMTRSGGQVLIGEHYWRADPDDDLLDAIGAGPNTYATHAENVAMAVRESFTPLYATVASEDELDHYELMQILAIERFARANPGDPQAREFRDRARSWRDIYLRWARHSVGFGLYLFLK